METKSYTVKLREKKLNNGNKSLYLDICHDGTRSYEFLKLYLIKASNSQQKQTNQKNRILAENIRAKRQLEIKNEEFGFKANFQTKASFLSYFMQLTEERKESNGNYGNWLCTYKHLVKYAKPSITFMEITPKFAEGFKLYLHNQGLSTNSQHSYFNKLKAAINRAFNDNIIPTNPIRNVKAVKAVSPKREYLTIEELRKLVATKCRYPVLKRAFLFSCLSGLRWSDVQLLTWKDVVKEEDGYRIIFRQKKTKGLEYLDLGNQATEYLGDRLKSDERVFIGLKYSSYMNVELSKWMMRAGILKDITYHCSRHTFAVLQLNLGTDIFTVSKLLGHNDLKTTQIYAQIVDEKKKAAMNIIPNITI